MSMKQILKNHSIFENTIESLIKYGLEIVNDKLPHKIEKKTKEEKRMLLEAILLRACALWENFIEKEIVYLINLDSGNFKNSLGLPINTKLNIKLIRAILYADRYYDYHDIEHYKSYFKKIISDNHNPFQNIPNDQIHKINFTYKIRNYLSHYSDFSRRKLLQAYKVCYSYRKFLEPGVFLLKQKGKNFEDLIHNFNLVSGHMKAKLRG